MIDMEETQIMIPMQNKTPAWRVSYFSFTIDQTDGVMTESTHNRAGFFLTVGEIEMTNEG